MLVVVRGILISIHAPAWGATKIHQLLASGALISIHAPAWGATSYAPVRIASCTFQSTLPHGERHEPFADNFAIVSISIHAPAWGATLTVDIDEETLEFQSTLPHGERPRMRQSV